MRTVATALAATLAGCALLPDGPGATPPPPSPAVAALVGEYGAADRLLIVYERDGALALQGRGHAHTPMERGDGGWTSAAGALSVERGADGAVSAVVLNGERLPRIDVGAQVQAAIRAGLNGSPDALRAAALAASPPIETDPKRPTDLVDLSTVHPRLRFDIRYAGADNFMGFALYERAGAWLQRPAPRRAACAPRRW